MLRLGSHGGGPSSALRPGKMRGSLVVSATSTVGQKIAAYRRIIRTMIACPHLTSLISGPLSFQQILVE